MEKTPTKTSTKLDTVIESAVFALTGEKRKASLLEAAVTADQLHPEALVIVDTIATDFCVTREQILASNRGVKRVAKARQVVMWLIMKNLKMRAEEAAGQLGRERTTASHAFGEIEKARENPSIEAYLDSLVVDTQELIDEIDGEDLI